MHPDLNEHEKAAEAQRALEAPGLSKKGFRRADTPRLRDLLVRTMALAVPILQRRRELGAPIEGLAHAWLWRRSSGRWRLWRACNVEDPLRGVSEDLRYRIAFTRIGDAVCIDGRDILTLSAIDVPRWTESVLAAAVSEAGELDPLALLPPAEDETAS